MPITRLLIGTIVFCAAGCSSAALKDRFRFEDIRFEQRLEVVKGAPVVVFGRVLEVQNVGSPSSSGADRRVKTQLIQVKASVEVPIKGNISKDEMQFYYFAFSSESSIGPRIRPYYPETGQERVFFLEPWENTFRSVGDVADYTLRVRSGGHPKDFCSGKTPESCIADMLLIPREGADPAEFAAYLPESAYVTSILCSPEAARTLLERLTSNTIPVISENAKSTLSMQGEKGAVPWSDARD